MAHGIEEIREKFHKASGSKDRFINDCKKCHHKKNREYKGKHRERVNELQRASYHAKKKGDKFNRAVVALLRMEYPALYRHITNRIDRILAKEKLE